MRVLYTAAHGGFDLSRVPLGGGATICYRLANVWTETRPFDFKILDPSLLGARAPVDKQLVAMNEWQYARFCRDFEKKITERILQENPREVVVLANDISEGPDFRRLAERGFAVYTIYHVDVLDYVARLYLRGWIRPERLARGYERLSKTFLKRLVPDIAGLVFQKQQDSVRFSRGLIVPSAAMKDVLLRCYPGVAADQVHVLPWGIWSDPLPQNEIDQEIDCFKTLFNLSSETPVLLTLSRISPEKGHDRLLKALAGWEAQRDGPPAELTLIIAGEAAYMQGRRFEKKLRRLAGRLRRTRVIFTGYAAGPRKQALFELADLFVFPSRHESYGLTLLEALRAGLPALACHSHGASDVMQNDFGVLMPPAAEREIPDRLASELRRLLSDRVALARMGQKAADYAREHSFEKTAARLADILKE